MAEGFPQLLYSVQASFGNSSAHERFRAPSARSTCYLRCFIAVYMVYECHFHTVYMAYECHVLAVLAG